MKFLKDAKLRAGSILREWKEKREEEKAQKALNADPANVTVPAWLVRAAQTAGWIAYAALMYFLWERVLDVSEAQHASLEVTHFGIWSNLNLAIFFPLIIGYVFVVIGVPYVAKISIPILVSLSWRDNFWPKLTSLVITILVSIVLITGTATVGSNAIIESERSAAVAVEQVQTSRAVLEGRIAAREAELRSMMENRNAYLAQAASVGAAEWQRSYIDQTPRSDPQYDRIVRALGAARAADAVRADRDSLREQLATSQTTAAVSSEVVTARTATLNSVMDFLNTFWVLMLAVVMDLACLFMPWIALRLEQTRNRQLSVGGGIPQHPWMISGPREGEKPRVGPEVFAGQRAQDVVEAMIAGGADPRFAADMARSAARATAPDELAFDEDGTPLTKVEYWKRQDGKPLVKNQKNKVVVAPQSMPDETGVSTDGGNRTATAGVTLGGRMETSGSVTVEREEEQREEAAGGQNTEQEPVSEIQSEPPIDFEELAAQVAEESVAHEEANDEAEQEPAAEPNGQSEAEQDITDHTDPQPEQREDRMLAPPSVAAE